MARSVGTGNSGTPTRSPITGDSAASARSGITSNSGSSTRSPPNLGRPPVDPVGNDPTASCLRNRRSPNHELRAQARGHKGRAWGTQDMRQLTSPWRMHRVTTSSPRARRHTALRRSARLMTVLM